MWLEQIRCLLCVFVQIGSLYEAFVLKMVLMRDLFFYGLFGSKVWSEIKETTFQVGHFTTISGHSIANYINIFHKTEVPTVILRCLMSLNLNWIKSYDINYKLFWQLCFSILEEKKASKMAIFWPFVVFFWQLHRYLSQNWDSDGHFEVLSVSKS